MLAAVIFGLSILIWQVMRSLGEFECPCGPSCASQVS